MYRPFLVVKEWFHRWIPLFCLSVLLKAGRNAGLKFYQSCTLGQRVQKSLTRPEHARYVKAKPNVPKSLSGYVQLRTDAIGAEQPRTITPARGAKSNIIHIR